MAIVAMVCLRLLEERGRCHDRQLRETQLTALKVAAVVRDEFRRGAGNRQLDQMVVAFIRKLGRQRKNTSIHSATLIRAFSNSPLSSGESGEP